MSVQPALKKPKTEPDSLPSQINQAFNSTPARPQPGQRLPLGQQQQQPFTGQAQVRPPFQLGRPPPGGVRMQAQAQNGMSTPSRVGQQGQGAFPPQQNGNAQAGPSNQASGAYNSGTPAGTSAAGGPAGKVGGGAAQHHDAGLDDLTDGIIDYKAEEAALQQHANQTAFRARPNGAANPKGQAFLDPAWLRRKMQDVASREYGLIIPDDSLAYLSLAAETRIRDLLTSMIRAKNHRLTASHAHPPPLHADGKTPLWDEEITSEPGKWLSTLERVEKEEEKKKRLERNFRDEEERRRIEMGELYDGPLGGGGAGGDVEMGTPGGEEGTKKKKKMGPGVSARNMSETAQKRMADSAALFSSGIKKKSWMFQTAGASPSPASRTLKASSPLGGSPPADSSSTSSSVLPNGAFRPAFGPGSSAPTNPSSLSQPSSWSRPFLSSTTSTPLAPPVHAASAPSRNHPRTSSGAAPSTVETGAVSMRDALFVLEKERGHGAGKGSATKLVGRALGKRNDRGWE